jgi:pantoate--beta-alanine ligase
MVGNGERRSAAIKKTVEELVLSHPYTQIDYVSLCDPVTLDDVDTLRGETLLALAVRVGSTRLIDNCVLGKSEKR